MVERNYNGPVIDASWSTAPWNKDGETIEATDDNAENGTMDTIAWPEGATPREELNDDQIAVIEKAARYRNVDNCRKLTKLAVGDSRSNSYAGSVLKVHWPERYWVPVEETSDQDYIEALGKDVAPNEKRYSKKGSCNSTSILTEDDVKEIRQRAMNGEYSNEIAEDFPVTQAAIKKAISGESWGHVSEYPPLKFDKAKDRYVAKDEETDYSTDELRTRVLDGESPKELAEEYDVTTKTIRRNLRGVNTNGNPQTPPLTYSGKMGWHVEGEEPEEREEQAQHTPDYDSAPVTQESSTDYTKYISIVAIVYMVYRVLRRLF